MKWRGKGVAFVAMRSNPHINRKLLLFSVKTKKKLAYENTMWCKITRDGAQLQ